jgi:hypothetical protein
MSQKTLDGNTYKITTCGDCRFLYRKIVGPQRKVWKCHKKPRGWGYDIQRAHVACHRFRPIKGG